MTLPPNTTAPADAPAPATEKVPPDAPGYPLGGPVPKTRAQLVAEQEAADAASKQADKDEAAEADKNNPVEPVDPLGPPGGATQYPS